MIYPESNGPGGDAFEGVFPRDLRPDSVSKVTWNRISQDYVIQQRIGEGGSAYVFEAVIRARTDRDGQTPLYGFVAIKVAKDEFQRAAFQNEFEAYSAKSFPDHLFVGFRDGEVYDTEIAPFLVLSRLRGLSIDSYFRANSGLKIAEKLKLCAQFWRRLHTLHMRGFAYGDLHRGNVFVEDGGDIQFLDPAGLKALRQTSIQPRMSLNLAALIEMPPSPDGGIITGKPTDIHAASSIAFHILTGKEHRDGTSDSARMWEPYWRKHLTAAGLSDGIQQVIVKGLQDPAETPEAARYISAKTMVSDLENAMREDAENELTRVLDTRHEFQNRRRTFGWSVAFAAVVSASCIAVWIQIISASKRQAETEARTEKQLGQEWHKSLKSTCLPGR